MSFHVIYFYLIYARVLFSEDCTSHNDDVRLLFELTGEVRLHSSSDTAGGAGAFGDLR